MALYHTIGYKETRILHLESPRLYVEVLRRPVVRLKRERGAERERVLVAAPPAAIVPGNHVAADLLAGVAVDKYVHHLPEYRQVKRLAELGLRLPASTQGDWVHATAARLYPLYESLGEAVRASHYLQVDEVPCRVADRQGACRAAYLWQFLDARPDSCGCYFHYQGGSRSRDVPSASCRTSAARCRRAGTRRTTSSRGAPASPSWALWPMSAASSRTRRAPPPRWRRRRWSG